MRIVSSSKESSQIDFGTKNEQKWLIGMEKKRLNLGPTKETLVVLFHRLPPFSPFYHLFGHWVHNWVEFRM